MANYDILPHDKRLESKTEEHLDDLKRLIDLSYDEKNGFVSEHSIVHEQGMTVMLYSIAKILSGEELSQDAQSAARQGFTFAVEVCKLVQPSEVALNIDFQAYLKDVPENEIKQYIEADTQTFLTANPAVEGLISHYLPKLDSTEAFTSGTQSITALTMMLAELSNSKSYVNGQIEDLEERFWEGR